VALPPLLAAMQRVGLVVVLRLAEDFAHGVGLEKTGGEE
jgi:hypothetical protein